MSDGKSCLKCTFGKNEKSMSYFVSVVRRWQQRITTLSCCCIFWAAELSHLCDAKLVPRDCCCSTDVASPPCASWRMMKVPVLPSALTMDDLCACICLYMDYQWLRRQASRWCGNMCRESQIPLYPEPLRLRDDGQLHTHQRLGHQRLSVGWAANEVWRDWLV